MRKTAVIALVASLLVVSCASRESLEQLAMARSQVLKLQEQIDYSLKNQPGVDNQILVSLLKDAETRQAAAAANVKREKEESREVVVGVIEEGIKAAAPIANGFAPGLGALLVAAAGLVGRFGKKKEA